jgi:hypothetical protein
MCLYFLYILLFEKKLYDDKNVVAKILKITFLKTLIYPLVFCKKKVFLKIKKKIDFSVFFFKFLSLFDECITFSFFSFLKKTL